MSSTITGTSTYWTITSPGGEMCGAAKKEATATLDADGIVVIKSGFTVLISVHIMSITGLVGATPALLFADLLNTYLTGSSSSAYTLAAARFGVDSSSNPGPVIGGLLFDPTTTTGGNWIVPMTSATLGLGIGDNYKDDTDDYFTLTNPTTITINVTGKYHLSMGWFVLSNDPLSPVVVQILKNGENIFTAPPAANDFNSGSTTGTSPISGLYTRAYSMNGAMDALLTAGDILSCKLYAEGGTGGDTAEISLTSALCIHLIGGTASGSGVPTSIVNATDTGEEAVTGALPLYSVKRFKAGSGMAVVSDATSITYSATGGGGATTVDNATDTGESLVTGSVPAYEVKRIKVAGGMTASSDATSVTLTGTAISNTLSGQPGSLVTGTFPAQQIKRVRSGTSAITVASDAASVIFTNALTVNNKGFSSGETLVDTTGFPSYTVKRITAGNGVAVTSNTNEVIVSSGNNGFNVSGSSGIAFTTTPTNVSMGSYRRNDGLLTWSGTATNSVTSGTVIHFDVGFEITTASTGIITFAVQDSGAGLLVRQYPAGYTGPVSFSGTVKSFYGGTISIQASSTVADGTFSTSSPVDFATNWFAGDLIFAP